MQSYSRSHCSNYDDNELYCLKNGISNCLNAQYSSPSKKYGKVGENMARKSQNCDSNSRSSRNNNSNRQSSKSTNSRSSKSSK